jgi:hypothetical protein
LCGDCRLLLPLLVSPLPAPFAPPLVKITSVEGKGLGRNYRRSKVEFTESKLAGDWEMTEVPVTTAGFLQRWKERVTV